MPRSNRRSAGKHLSYRTQPDRYRLRKRGLEDEIFDRTTGAAVMLGGWTASTAHIEPDLLRLAAAILNGRIPEAAPVGPCRYRAEFTRLPSCHPKGEPSPSIQIIDLDRDSLPLLIARTDNPNDADNFAAIRATQKVAEHLNRIGFEWVRAQLEDASSTLGARSGD